MKKNIFYLLLSGATLVSLAFTRPAFFKVKWTALYNGRDLSGWDTYIGPPLNDAGKMINTTPVGLNTDPKNVFSVVNHNNEKVIRISGESWGGISTKKEYQNFHFQLKFKWGSLKWGQKKDKKRDSGLLYFAVGRHGADYGAWMRSQEFQIEEGNSGDYWGVAGALEDIPSVKNADNYVYDAAGEMLTFSATSKTGRHCVKRGDAENPTGEWNTLDLYCYKGTSVHVINGKVMMVLYNSRQLDKGKEAPLTKGKIQIQSEGAEVFYKDIKISPIAMIPTGMK
jgi:hypothetical protein